MAGGRQTLHSERFCGRSNGRIKPIVPDAASVMSGGFAQGAGFAKPEATACVRDVTGPNQPWPLSSIAALQLHQTGLSLQMHDLGAIDLTACSKACRSANGREGLLPTR